MPRLQPGTIGILPAGALGVAFAYHLTDRFANRSGDVCFLEREGSASGAALREKATLRVDDDVITAPALWRPNLLTCYAAGWLPEIVLVCTQPDQLLGVTRTVVRLIEQLHADDALDAAATELPAIVLCSNGIYFQRVRQYFVELLEESITFGRLPELWPERMPRIIGKLLRGVTIQTGQRVGAGAEASYHPGARGRTRLAGGDATQRALVAGQLSARGGWCDVAARPSATRAEFDKALVNLCANLLGQLQAIDETGRFRLLTVREILDAGAGDAMRTLAEHVIAIGRAVGAYGADEAFELLHEQMLESVEQHADHVPSSLQWIAQHLRAGTLQAQLTPTERWLLEPLIRYANGAGLENAAQYFQDLTRRVEHRLAVAIAAASQG